MTHSTVDIVVNPSDETFQLGPLVIRFLVTGDDTRESASVFEFMVPAGEMLRAPAHSHDAFEETVYGLEGVLTWTVDGRPIEVAPGQALCIPRGAVHRFDNLGQEDARVLVIASPALFGPAYFRDMAAAVAEAASGHPDQARMADIMLRHGLTPASPAA
ncbi:MAG TPA: cupin domain-containing protein [Thermomicrobiales bacterium]|nr:cupin domain-containing protein [Thermomicrobiales bacterium]